MKSHNLKNDRKAHHLGKIKFNGIQIITTQRSFTKDTWLEKFTTYWNPNFEIEKSVIAFKYSLLISNY
jgi:hypothetical protein